MKCNRTRCLLFIGWLLALPCWAQDSNLATPIDIRALLTKHDQALTNQDLAAILDTFAADAVLMGTGPGEYWAGQEAIKDAYQHFFSDYDAGSLDINCTWHSVGTNGRLAWLMAMCQMTDYLKNEKREFALNISAVAEKERGVWRFRTFHASNLTGNGQSDQPAP